MRPKMKFTQKISEPMSSEHIYSNVGDSKASITGLVKILPSLQLDGSHDGYFYSTAIALHSGRFQPANFQ